MKPMNSKWLPLFVLGSLIGLNMSNSLGADPQIPLIEGAPGLKYFSPASPPPFIKTTETSDDRAKNMDQYAILSDCESPDFKPEFAKGYEQGKRGSHIFPNNSADRTIEACSGYSDSSPFSKMSQSKYNNFTNLMLDQELWIAEVETDQIEDTDHLYTNHERDIAEAIAETKSTLQEDFGFSEIGPPVPKTKFKKALTALGKFTANIGASEKTEKSLRAKNYAYKYFSTLKPKRKSISHKKHMFFSDLNTAKQHCCLRGLEFGQTELLYRMQLPYQNDGMAECRKTFTEASEVASQFCIKTKKDDRDVCNAQALFLKKTKEAQYKGRIGCFNLGFKTGLKCIPGSSPDCFAINTKDESGKGEITGTPVKPTNPTQDSTAAGAW